MNESESAEKNATDVERRKKRFASAVDHVSDNSGDNVRSSLLQTLKIPKCRF